MKYLKFAAKRLFRLFDLEIRRSGAGARDTWLKHDDPVSAQYLCDLPQAPVVQIDTGQARAGVAGFPCAVDSGHPLIKSLRAISGIDNPMQAAATVRLVLQEYYSRVRPVSAADVVGVAEHEAPGFAGIPLHSWVFPWSERSVDGITAHRKICLEEEAMAYGRRLSLSDGGTFYGPVSDGKIELEVARLLKLHRSFQEHGFKAGVAPPVEVLGLRDGHEYRWLITQGQHRLAACAAFGISRADAKVMRIIRREDAEFWPHVASGTFTKPGALRCFDRIFAGEPFPAADPWLRLQHKNTATRWQPDSVGETAQEEKPERQWAAKSLARHAMDG